MMELRRCRDAFTQDWICTKGSLVTAMNAEGEIIGQRK